MNAFTTTLSLCAASLALLTAQDARAADAPSDTCAQAKVLAEAGRFDLADGYAEQCYEKGSASRELVIFGHYVKAVALSGLGKTKEALEQLEILLQPAYASSPIYDRRSNGLDHLGATQASISADAARLSLGLGDADKSLDYVQKALALAALAPAVHVDVAGNAYMLRARIRAERQDNRGAAVDIARAYIRGSQDPFVVENVKTFPAAEQERVNGLKGRMLSAYNDYLNMYMASGTMTLSGAVLDKLKVEGDTRYKSALADETAYLGPDA